jgi:photosystem II stability/assembly factor-like uncharacterized protein
MPRRAAIVLAACAALVAPAHARAVSWTPVQSGTPDDIAALAYAPDGLRYATSTGKILRRAPDGTVAQEAAFSGRHFFALAMSPSGRLGLAGADGGRLYRYDQGTWSPVSLTATTYPFVKCASAPASPLPRLAAPTADFRSVAWSSDTVAWATTATQGQVFRSTDGGATWEDVGRQADQTCRIPEVLTDIAPVPGSEQDVFFVDANSAGLWRTTDALQTPVTRRVQLAHCAGTVFRLALDPSAPARLSGVGNCSGAGQQALTTDAGFSTDDTPAAGPPLRDVAGAPGVFLSVGDAGTIIATTDARTAIAQPAQGGQAQTNWRAIAFADPSHAAVAGAGGALAVSSDASAVPDLQAPTATVAGPLRVLAAVPVAFTATAQDAGGAGIDPAGYSWAGTGLTAPSAVDTATYVFPAPGAYVVQMTARDRAGNVSSLASLAVQALRARLKPPAAVPATARRTRRGVIVRVSGAYGIPKRLTKAQLCRGTVILSAIAGPRHVGRRARLARSCRFTGTLAVRLPRAQARRVRALRLRARYLGGTLTASVSRTWTVSVR